MPSRVFISYAWEDEAYRSWVKGLATRLRTDGVDARLDQWHLKEGSNIPEFMNREIRNADVVLLLCSPGYRTKVHGTEEGERMAGVGWEARLLTGRLLANHRGLTIPALTRGAWEESSPDFVATDLYVDLSDPQTFEASYQRLLERLTGTAEAAPEVGKPPPARTRDPERSLRAGDVTLEFRLTSNGDEGIVVELSVDGEEPVSAPFRLDLSSGGSQTRREAEAIESGQCTPDDIQSFGSELLAKLHGGDAVERRFQSARRECRERPGSILEIRLSVPPSLESIPWESLFDFDEGGSLATSPIASVVRSPSGLKDQDAFKHQRVSGRALRMLMVVPAGSGLATSSEWEKIQQVLRVAKDTVRLECLDGRVTPNRLAETLRQGWDIVHFIGHGRLDHGRVEIRLNRDATEDEGNDEHWMAGPMFAQQFLRSPPGLVVLNCCHGGAIHPIDLASLGGSLIRAKVPAVVVMRYEIHDSVAADFSGTFYRELVSGERAGRVDLAVQEGRAALARTYPGGSRSRAYITPALYLLADCEQLFEIEKPKSRATRVDADIDPGIDTRLVNAVRAGACLPILGADILAAGAVRGEEIPSGPAKLVQQLAAKCDFPGFDRLTPLTDSTAAWLTLVLFQRVCQHFESVAPGERRDLNAFIQEVYRTAEPPEILEEIASWRFPGLVYGYVDGLLETLLQRTLGRELRVAQAEGIHESSTTGANEVVLLNLRGTYTHPQSMVLTESDAESIMDSMGAIGHFVEDLMNRVDGCTLLFLGVSPRDPLTRALARCLLRREVARKRATAFFVCDCMTDADRSYWRQFEKLEFLELDPGTLIHGLTVAARTGGSR